MTDPEYNARCGMSTVPTSSSTVGVMQNSRVFCDFDLSTQYNSIHELKDILLEVIIHNNDPALILYLTSTYAFYDLIQIMIDDNVVEEIRSDNAFVDHQYYDSDILSKYSLLEGFGDRSIRPVPNLNFIPYIPIAQNTSEKVYIVVPPNCICNKNVPLPFLKSSIKLRIYFKTASLVISDYNGTQKFTGSQSFTVTSLNAILIGNKYDDLTLSMLSEKFVGKVNTIKTLTHVWKTTNIGRPQNNQIEFKVSINGDISDITFFIRDSNTAGIRASQYSLSTNPADLTVINPFSVFRLDNITLKDSNGDYTNFYSNISGQVLNLVANKYNKINSPWNSIFPTYTFKFSDDLFDTVSTGSRNGSCKFDGNFNIIFTPLTDFTSSLYISNSVDLIMAAHQYRTFLLDANGKLSLSKN